MQLNAEVMSDERKCSLHLNSRGGQSDPMSTRPRTLDMSQIRAFNACRRGQSVAILGSAGSGKSYLLSAIAEDAKMRLGGAPSVTACAPTSHAAEIMGGLTVQSLLGVPFLWDLSKEKVLDIVSRSKTRVDYLRGIRTIMIDDVGALSTGQLDTLDYVLRIFADSDRQSRLPMGGRQLVVCGDPFQSDPIGMKKGVENTYHSFYSRTWFTVFGGYGSGITAVLKGNYRQSGDDDFFYMLNRIRHGKVSSLDVEIINGTCNASPTPPLTHTAICSNNSAVDAINERVMSETSGPLYTFHAHDKYSGGHRNLFQKIVKHCLPDTVRVKVGTFVILTKQVGHFHSGARVKLESLSTAPRHTQKSGDSYDVRMKELNSAEFTVTCGTQKEVTRGFMTDVKLGDESSTAYRIQVPFVPAYAITVHRSQGMTLTSVAVDFTSSFKCNDEGSVYTALSRCVSLEGLWVRGIRPDDIRANPRGTAAIEYMRSIQDRFPWRFLSWRNAVTPLRKPKESSTDKSEARGPRKRPFVEVADGLPTRDKRRH